MPELAIQTAIEATAKFKENINKILSEPRYVGNLLEINANIRRVEARLQFMGGKLPGDHQKAAQERTATRGPIKNFMGRNVMQGTKELMATEKQQRLNADPEAKKKSQSPEEADLEQLRKRVDKLYKDILNFPPQSVLTNFRAPGDVRVVRGLAKTVGIQDYKNRAMDIVFIQEIQMAVAKANEQAALATKADQGAEQPKKPLTGAAKASAEKKAAKDATAGDKNDDDQTTNENAGSNQ